MNITGDVLKEIKKLNDCSQNIIFTDPPYSLGNITYIDKNNKPQYKGKSSDFMSAWAGLTGSDIEQMFVNFYRVLKHGGFVVFAGQMRQAMTFQYYAISAQFECMESIYSFNISNFPKSLDVGKAIDKCGGNNILWFSEWLRDWRKKNKITQKDVSKLFPSKTGSVTGCVANWELGLNLPSPKQFSKIVEHFNLPFKSIQEAEREIIGQRIADKTVYQAIGEKSTSGEIDITAPASSLAKKYSQIKSSICPLKQTTEIWHIFRKPFKTGSVTRDIIAYEDGDNSISPSGLDINAGRVPASEFIQNGNGQLGKKGIYGNMERDSETSIEVSARYPAQLFLDGKINYKRKDIDLENKDFLEFIGIDIDCIKFMEAEKALDYICQHLDKFDASKLLDEQSGITKSWAGQNHNNFNPYGGNALSKSSTQRKGKFEGYNDSAGCSRILHNSGFTLEELYQHIFYSKPSNFERNAGCNEFERKHCRRDDGQHYGMNTNEFRPDGSKRKEVQLKQNLHPTLKSLALLYKIIALFNTVDIEKMKILIPFSGVSSEKIAWLAHGALEENITAIEINPEYVEIGKAREKFWIENNFFFKNDKIMWKKIKKSLVKENKIKQTGQAELF